MPTILIADHPDLFPVDIPDPTLLEVCNSEVGDRYEAVEIGPLGGGEYLRLRTADMVVLAVELHRLADLIIDGALDAREVRAAADMVECPGCRTRIARDDTSCGTVRCDRIASLEASL